MFMVFSIALFFIMGVGFVFFMDLVIVASGKLINIHSAVQNYPGPSQEPESTPESSNEMKVPLLEVMHKNEAQYTGETEIKQPDLLL